MVQDLSLCYFERSIFADTHERASLTPDSKEKLLICFNFLFAARSFADALDRFKCLGDAFVHH